MAAQDLVEHQDKRTLVLIALGLGVMALHWLPFNVGQPSSDFISGVAGKQYLAASVRIQKNSSVPIPADAVRLSGQTSCADTPPRLALFFNLPMPVNQADFKDLIMLPGIGPRMAERILNFRTTQGPISGPESLKQIRGIGPKLTDRLLPLVCFD